MVPMAMPVNIERRLIAGRSLAIAMTLIKPRTVAAKNSGCENFRAKVAKGAAAKASINALQSPPVAEAVRSEEHTSELQSLMRISYAVFCLKKKNTTSVSL